jgi:hypothetical protein
MTLRLKDSMEGLTRYPETFSSLKCTPIYIRVVRTMKITTIGAVYVLLFKISRSLPGYPASA